MSEPFDVAIVGSGPAGAATAIALAAKGRSVVVIERSHYEAPRIGETLPPRARLPLVRLGVWERFLQAGHLPSPGTLAAWGAPELTASDFVFNPYGSGWHLDRKRFDEMLAERASEAGGRVVRGARVTRCARGDGRAWRLESDAGVHRAKFLVDATGRMAWVTRQLAVRRVEYDRLVGLVTFARAEPNGGVAGGSQDTRTLVESTRDGWWYSARLPNAQLVVAYMTDADLLPMRKSQLRAFWERELATAPHTRDRVGDGAFDRPLHTLAANSFRLTRVAGEDWLAVGDAALAVDPLSSRGLYNALESGLSAGAAIDRRLRGDSRGLDEYASQIDRQFARYLEQRARYYSLEERWREATFWKRRQVNGNLPAKKNPLNTRDTDMEEIDNVS